MGIADDAEDIVLNLEGGAAVAAKAGQRERFRPIGAGVVQGNCGAGAPGKFVEYARFFPEHVDNQFFTELQRGARVLHIQGFALDEKTA